MSHITVVQVQLNLMAPTRDNYYGNQQTIQGLVFHMNIKYNKFKKMSISLLRSQHNFEMWVLCT